MLHYMSQSAMEVTSPSVQNAPDDYVFVTRRGSLAPVKSCWAIKLLC